MHDTLLKGEEGMLGGGPRGAEFAAAYAFYIVQGHPFADGNKRTASAAMFAFLEGNRSPAKISTEDTIEMMIKMQERARGGESASETIHWIAGKLRGKNSRRRT